MLHAFQGHHRTPHRTSFPPRFFSPYGSWAADRLAALLRVRPGVQRYSSLHEWNMK
jgi:hypothetical protein